jgi:gamma-glutamyltranspeptidase/glutathione hydrolase
MSKAKVLNLQGPGGARKPATGRSAVCATQHPLVVDAVLDVMRGGGNAIDAAIAGSLVQATVQPSLTCHAGTVNLLYWEASSGRTFELNGSCTVVPDLPPFRPVPRGISAGRLPPCAVIPGFMPAMKALYERFASRPWAELCEPAIRWAEEGHEVGSFEHVHTSSKSAFFFSTVSGRAHFAANGRLPEVGERWPRPELARTLCALAKEGPDYFTRGEWGQRFVARANELGWPVTLEHMDAIPPRWGEGLRYQHRGFEIIQLSPPEGTGVRSALVLGILDALGVASLGHYTESAEALYYIAHALRRADYETGFLNDPEIFDDPSETLLSPDLHAFLAEVIRRSRPKIDLTNHVKLVAGPTALAAAGGPCSCELSLVDPEGNWVQTMNTPWGGGIPGEVIGGVPMDGSELQPSLNAPLAGWFTGGGRMRSTIGNTLVFKDGKPVWSLGTPASPDTTVPQVLLNRLHYGMDHYEAEDAPRMFPLTDDYKLQIESRIPASVVADLAKLGIFVEPLAPYSAASGAVQMSWRDDDGTLHALASARMPGDADGF